MEITINVPRKINVTIDQIEQFLNGSGWEKQSHNEYINKFQCIKYPKVYALLPKEDGLSDEKAIVVAAILVIESVNNNCGVETIINRILGDSIGDWVNCPDEYGY